MNPAVTSLNGVDVSGNVIQGYPGNRSDWPHLALSAGNDLLDVVVTRRLDIGRLQVLHFNLDHLCYGGGRHAG